MDHKIECKWIEGNAFEADVNGYKIQIDSNQSKNGRIENTTPKPLLLTSLAGCTGVDVIHILNKMRLNPEYFNIEIKAELTDTNPKYYKHIHIIYIINGGGITLDKVEKAVKLSMETYCGVSAMLSKAAEITWEIKLNESN